MTASDDGEFKPHQGDPWHPGWSDDAVPGEEIEAAESDGAAKPESKKKRKKKKRRGRRERRADAADAAGFAGPDLDSTIPVFDTDDELPGGELPLDDDPFDAVLEREGRASRHRPVDDDEVPVPAWTIDREPDSDQVLPVEQPSWVGQDTGGTPGVEAIGFEPAQAEAREDEDASDETLEPDLDSLAAAIAAQEASKTDSSDRDLAGADVAELLETEEEPSLIGEYGVAGPEAFDALEKDDATTGELDDWEAFTEGPSPAPGTVQQQEAEAPQPPTDAVDEWVESQPKKRRRLFGKGKRDRAEEVIDDSAIGIAWDDGMDGSAVLDATAYHTDEDRVEDLDHGELVEPVMPETVAVPAEAIDEAGPESVEQLEGVEGAVAEMLEALEQDTWAAPDESDGVELPVEAVIHESIEAAPLSPYEGGEQLELVGDSQELPAATEMEGAFDSDGLQRDVTVPTLEPRFEDTPDWEGDPGRVPTEWFANIDEDVVVPPAVTETPETEWSRESEGGRREEQTREPFEPIDAFDIEGPEPSAVAPQPQEIAVIPDGYEPWQDAVTDAVEAGAGAHVDDGIHANEQPMDPRPAPADLPAGFEHFPGSAEIEQFELPEETMQAEMSADESDEDWVTDDVIAERPTQEIDAPFPVGEDEFADQVHSSTGTIEHRDLAAAISGVGEVDTEWQGISAAMPGLETGVLGFEDVGDLGASGEHVGSARPNLGSRVVTGLVLAGLLFGSLFTADVAFAGFIGLLVVLGLAEFYGSARRSGYLPLSLFGIVGGVGTLLATWFHGPLAIPVGVLLTSIATFFFYAFSPTRRDALSNGGLTVLGVGWVIATVAFVIPISRAPEHVVLIFAIVAVTAATDIGAFLSGRTWGRSPLAPVLSPNKTTEGLAGGVTLALVVAGAIGFLELGPFDIRSGLGLGAIAAVFAPIGDLSESMIKRGLGIKDMGSVLPGHGGVLDRIDAFLFVIPAAWVFYEAIGFLG